jgi:hypothetical protein
MLLIHADVRNRAGSSRSCSIPGWRGGRVVGFGNFEKKEIPSEIYHCAAAGPSKTAEAHIYPLLRIQSIFIQIPIQFRKGQSHQLLQSTVGCLRNSIGTEFARNFLLPNRHLIPRNSTEFRKLKFDGIPRCSMYGSPNFCASLL